MNHIFAEPLHNEHLFSWLLRLYKLSGYDEFLYYQKKLGIEDRFLLANKVFTPTTDIMIAYCDDTRKAMLENTATSLWWLYLEENTHSFGLLNHMNEQQMFSFDTSWHSCAQCRKEDLINFGTSYWHSQHQIASTFSCYKHNTILEHAQEPIKNLFTECLPHDVDGWKAVIKNPHEDIMNWQCFVLKMKALFESESELTAKLRSKITQILALDTLTMSERRAICKRINPAFEEAIGPVLLAYLFRDYKRFVPTRKPNILTAMFANADKSKGERNPIYWIVLAYWLRHKLGL